jgi:Response regulator containing CheY-like receiver domain and AraC-type DNA-binding domain
MKKLLDKNNLEALYNFKSLGEAILKKDETLAYEIFHMQSAALLTNREHPDFSEFLRIFLNSMNRSIYCFILYALDISLHEYCFRNKDIMHNCNTLEDFYLAGESIISWYCKAFNCDPKINVYIHKAKEYIEAHLTETITLAQVAAHIFVSKCYLCQLFATYTKHTFSSYVCQCRIERAKKLLLYTEYSMQEIAATTGFSTSSYFSRTFRRIEGTSPKKYRDENLGD